MTTGIAEVLYGQLSLQKKHSVDINCLCMHMVTHNSLFATEPTSGVY